jgi:hypothetical protein
MLVNVLKKAKTENVENLIEHFNFSQNEINKILKKLYWMNSDSISSVHPITIHETTKKIS